jgi:hypothetical protein
MKNLNRGCSQVQPALQIQVHQPWDKGFIRWSVVRVGCCAALNAARYLTVTPLQINNVPSSLRVHSRRHRVLNVPPLVVMSPFHGYEQQSAVAYYKAMPRTCQNSVDQRRSPHTPLRPESFDPHGAVMSDCSNAKVRRNPIH